MISPAEKKVPWTSGPITTANYSYALLAVAVAGARQQEWRDTVNTDGAIISDRNSGSDAGTNISSIHTAPARGDWRGDVAWNDNHVSWETDAILTCTVYGQEYASTQPGKATVNDHLFQSPGPDDALMIHSGSGQ